MTVLVTDCVPLRVRVTELVRVTETEGEPEGVVERERVAQALRVVEREEVSVAVAHSVGEGLGEMEALPLMLSLPQGDGLADWLGEAVCVGLIVRVGERVRLGACVTDMLMLGQLVEDTLTVLLTLGVTLVDRVVLLLAHCEGERESVRDMVPVTLRVGEAGPVPEGERLAATVPLGVLVRHSVTEGLEEKDSVALPVPLPHCEGDGDTVTQPEGVRLAERVVLPV